MKKKSMYSNQKAQNRECSLPSTFISAAFSIRPMMPRRLTVTLTGRGSGSAPDRHAVPPHRGRGGPRIAAGPQGGGPAPPAVPHALASSTADRMASTTPMVHPAVADMAVRCFVFRASGQGGLGGHHS